MKKANGAVLVTGVIGEDVHVTGIRILEHALRNEGYEVHSLGIHNTQDDFIRKAKETHADAVLISSLAGHATMLVEEMRENCNRAGIGNIRLMIGGQLVIHAEEWKKTEETFIKMGFDSVAAPFALPGTVIRELNDALPGSGGSELDMTG
jgi:methylaspartate mutase sigma subunit